MIASPKLGSESGVNMLDAALWVKLRAQIDDVFYRVLLDMANCGPFDGGCVVVARALQRVFGGEVVVLTRANGCADHAAVLISGLLSDFDGPLEPIAFIRRFNKLELASAVTFRRIDDRDLPGAFRSAELEDRLVAMIAAALARIANPSG